MNLHIMLDETSQSPKDRLHEVLQIIKFMETERGMVAAIAWREKGTGSCYLMGTKFQFYKMEKVLEMDGVDGCAHYECT